MAASGTTGITACLLHPTGCLKVRDVRRSQRPCDLDLCVPAVQRLSAIQRQRRTDRHCERLLHWQRRGIIVHRPHMRAKQPELVWHLLR